jgi:hypothetical protein
VIPLLQAKGLHVVAVQNPLTSLADDVAATTRWTANHLELAVAHLLNPFSARFLCTGKQYENILNLVFSIS